MAPPDNPHEQSDDGPPTSPLAWYRKPRFLWWTGGSLLSVILAALLIIFVLPTPLARLLIASELEEMGIDSTGLKTIELDLWNSEIKLGPIDLWSEGSAPGQIQLAILDYDFDSLFDRQILIEAVVIEEVDLFIKRDEEGGYTINGIDPDQFLGQSEAPDASEEEEGSSWVAGVSKLRVRNSLVRLEDFTGGELTLEIDELVLKDLNTWTPNEGGDFDVKMALNEIGLVFQGKVQPFSDPIHISMRGGLRDATLDKISRFTGPLGFAHQDGVMDSDLDRDMYFYSDGRVEGATKGTIVIKGLDVASEDLDRVQFEKAEFEVDTSSTIYPDDSFEYAGTIKSTLEKLAVQSAEGGKGSAEKIELTIADFRAAQRGDLRSSGEAVTAAVPASQNDETAPSLISKIVLTVAEVVREILAHDLEFEASPSTMIEGIDIAIASTDGGPSFELKTDSLVATAPGLQASTIDAGWRIEGALKGLISKTISTVDQDGSVIVSSVKTVDLDAPRIDASTGETDTSVSFDVRTRFEDFVTSESKDGSPDAIDIAVGVLETNTAGFEVRSGPAGERAAGPLDIALEAFHSNIKSADSTAAVKASAMLAGLSSMEIVSSGGAGEVKLSGRTEVRALSASQTGVEGKQEYHISTAAWKSDIGQLKLETLNDGASIEGQFDLDFSTIEAQFGSGRMNVDSWRTTVPKLSFDTRNEDVALTGTLKTELSGISTETEVETAALDLRVDRLEAELTSLDVVSGAEKVAVSLAGQSTMENFDTTLAQADARPGGNAALGHLNVALEEFAFAGGASPTWRTRADLEAVDLSVKTSDEITFSLALGGLDAKGLGRSETGQINLDEADLSALSVAFSDRAIAIATDEENGDDGKTDAALNEDAAPAKLRVGRLTLAEGSKIEFVDTSVEPIARFIASIKETEVENFDTEAPAEKTTIKFQAALNDHSEVSLSGWMSPLKEPLGFNLAGNVSDAVLPDFSPYIAELSGFNIETGQLTSNFAALTEASDLNGKLDVLISELDLSSASDETSENFQADYGVPIELAVGLLEDKEGKISLEFPIGGTVDAPEIDYSDAIKTAIQGVLTAFFPTFDFLTETGAMSFEPIVFPAGEVELDDTGRGFGQKIAKFLEEKPKLSIKVCGKATAADFLATVDDWDQKSVPDEEEDAIQGSSPDVQISTDNKQTPIEELTLTDAEAEKLLDIATARTNAARKYLIEDAGLKEELIGQCRVTYNMKDKKPPRVEVRF